ncbi:MAG: glycosyltransferase family 25 protein [Planctomycetota bacterium]
MNLADKTFVISLAKRSDRRESVSEQLASIGHDDYEIFDAYGVEHLPPESYYKDIPDFEMSGWYGNKFSHYGVIEKAKSDGLKSVMVLEDDVAFHPDFNAIVDLALSQLKAIEWDWLQFGGNHRYFGGVNTLASPIDGMPYAYVSDGLIQVAPNLARIVKMLTAHAYIVREPVYDFILEHAIKSPLSIDGFYCYEVHNRFKCYCVTPCVATQIPGVSDIGDCYIDYRQYIGD